MAAICSSLMASWKREPSCGASAAPLEHGEPLPSAGKTFCPLSHLTTMNSAWSIRPARISGSRTTPASSPKWAAVASEPRPSASSVPMRVRPPQPMVIVPPPAGLLLTAQRAYSQPPAWSTTARWASELDAARAASGMRTCMPSTSQVPQLSVQCTVKTGSAGLAEEAGWVPAPPECAGPAGGSAGPEPQPVTVLTMAAELPARRGLAGSSWLNGLASEYGRQHAPGMATGEAKAPQPTPQPAVIGERAVLVPVVVVPVAVLVVVVALVDGFLAGVVLLADLR